MDWLINLFRSLFFFLDGIVYPLIGMVYNLFVDIANTTVFTDDIINIFAEKVYALLGVFMLFKVSFSIMTYIVNPDEFTDKTKGFSKMISNIVITLAILILTPLIFSEAMDIQRIVLKDNIIGKIFSTTETSSVSIIDAGNTMSYETFKAFYYLDTDEYQECLGIYSSTGASGSTTGNCSSRFPNYENYKEDFQIAESAKSLDAYMNPNLVNEKSNNNEYVMTYMPLISTIAGGFICWILIVFCFDVAIRSIKLGFLRMIAPIPIISRIDPKKGKEVFNKWVKTCVSTYLDLFIRLLAIYFAVYVIGIVADMKFVDAVSNNTPANVDPFVKVFIILGALLFAKQLPKLLEELIPGLKLNGKFTLNPLKKMAEVPLVGQGASRALGAVGSIATGNGFKAGWREGGKAVPLLGGDGKQSIATAFNRYNMLGEDARKKREEREKSILNAKRGQELLNSTLTNKLDDDGNVITDNNGKPIMEVDTAKQYGIYQNQAYADSVKSVDDAKDRKNRLQSEYEQLKMRLETEGSSMSEESRNALIKSVDAARITSVKADSDYEKIKKAHQEIRKQNVKLAEIEDLFNSAKDEFEAKAKVLDYTTKQKLNVQNNTNISDIEPTQLNDNIVVESTQTPQGGTFINTPESDLNVESYQIQYDKLMAKERETRTIVENIEAQFQVKRSEYQNSVANGAISEEKKAKIAREYANIQQAREQAIFDHERALNALNNASNQNESSGNSKPENPNSEQ